MPALRDAALQCTVTVTLELLRPYSLVERRIKVVVAGGATLTLVPRTGPTNGEITL